MVFEDFLPVHVDNVNADLTLSGICLIDPHFPSPAPIINQIQLLHTEHFRHLPGRINGTLDRLWKNII